MDPDFLIWDLFSVGSLQEVLLEIASQDLVVGDQVLNSFKVEPSLNDVEKHVRGYALYEFAAFPQHFGP